MKKTKDHKNEPVNFKFGINDPTLFDLIDRYFPEPYRTTYMDAEVLYKSARAAAKIKLPPGYRVDDYLDVIKIQNIAIELHKESPEMTAEQMAVHPKMKKQFGRETPETTGLYQKSFKAIIKHIKELGCIPSNPVGRPKGSTKPICITPCKSKP